MSLSILSKVFKIEAHFVLDCPFYNSIRDRFPSLFQVVTLSSLKSFYKLVCWIDIGCYLTHATTLGYFRELAFSSHKPFEFLDTKMNFNLFNRHVASFLIISAKILNYLSM